VNGEYYIGIHSTDKMDDNYNGSGTVFKNKYNADPDSFTKTILCYRDTRDQVASIEGFLVTEETIKEHLCLNEVPGGDRGFSGGKHTEETKEKISASLMGKKHTAESKAKMSASSLGKKHTAESKAKMSASHMGNKHTAETRAKMSASQKDKKFTAETRAKIAASHMGNKHTAETLEKLSGKNHHHYDPTVRTIEKPDATGVETKKFTGTRQGMLAAIPELTPGGLNKMLRRIYQTHKGWRLVLV
jgi:hypothetical protein